MEDRKIKILHWMKQESSGLARSTLEIVRYEELAGHDVCIQQPSDSMPIYGNKMNGDNDIHCIHSQLNPTTYHDRKPKIMWMHGEPLSSVANGISMKAIIDLSASVDAFICMRRDELPIWSSIKKTYRVRKGVDLDYFKPIPMTPKLSGDPAILYAENWRGERNPLYLCVAMETVWKKFPNARLHLYNVTNQKMLNTFKALINHNKWSTFIRSIQGPREDINALYNSADIVVSCLFPLYARVIEALGAGKAIVAPGYDENDYPFTCKLHPDSMADALINCWENYGNLNYRKFAEDHHNIKDTVKEAIEVYERYI